MEWQKVLICIALILGGVCLSGAAVALFRTYASGVKARIAEGEEDAELLKDALLALSRTKRGAWRRIVGKIALGIFSAACLIFFAMFLLTFANGGRPVAGVSLMAVATGSMEGVHPVNADECEGYEVGGFGRYSLIFLLPADSAGGIKRGDVIAFDDGEKIVVHRVVDIVGNGDIRYVTRGDANIAADDFQPSQSQVIGIYSGVNIPYVGIVVLFLQSIQGMAAFVAAIVFCALSFSISGGIERCRAARRAELVDKLNISEFSGVLHFCGAAYVFDRGAVCAISPSDFVRKDGVRLDSADSRQCISI